MSNHRMPKQKKLEDPEQKAREQGKTIPFYTRKVAKALSTPKKTGKFTPSKRG